MEGKNSRLESGWFALLAGGFFGWWLLLEPLVSYGSRVGAIGQPLSALLLSPLAVGASLALALWLVFAALPITRPHAGKWAGSGTAATLAGLILFWALRGTEASILGQRSFQVYGAVSLLLALLIFFVGGKTAQLFSKATIPRILVLGVLAFGPAMAAMTAFHTISNSPKREEPSSLAWADSRIERVYLITIDALRADHLGTYGCDRPTSPTLDRLASEGITFLNCYAQGNRSELSFGSLLTGLYPSAHAVSRATGRLRPLAPAITTLAEVMSANGFSTVGMMSNPYLKPGWGLDQGFHEKVGFVYYYRRLLLFRMLEKLNLMREPQLLLITTPRGNEVTDAALSALRDRRDEPVFSFIHYMDVHHPYLPPDSVEVMFRTPGASSKSAGLMFAETTTKHEGELISPADLTRLEDLYDGSIRYCDSEVDRLLQGLEAEGMLEKSLIVFTSDHGDEFNEHGYIYHDNPEPSESLTRVPLILWSPTLFPEPQTIQTPVQHVDIFPTLVHLLGLSGAPAVQGSPLPITPNLPFDPDRLIVSEGADHLAIRRWEDGEFYKFMGKKGGEMKLFHLASDPEEAVDISAGQPNLIARMNDGYRELERSSRTFLEDAGDVKIDKMTLEELRSLGYIGSSSGEAGSSQ